MKPQEALRQAMERENVSQVALAVVIGGSHSTARNMLAGQKVGFKYWYRAAQFFGLDVEKLVPELHVPRTVISSVRRAKSA